MSQTTLKPRPFARPLTPVAKCLHNIRLSDHTIRQDLVKATGLSQPTVTRAISSLIHAGLVKERTDLATSSGPGRPTIPLELAPTPWILAGIVVGTTSSYIAFFDTKGRILKETTVKLSAQHTHPNTFIEHLNATINRLLTSIDYPLVSIGVATSGRVSKTGAITASNLGWNDVDIASHLNYQFGVPTTISSAIAAFAAAEIQTLPLTPPDTTTPITLSFHADDSVGSAYSDQSGVHILNRLEDSLSTERLLDRCVEIGVRATSVAEVATKAETNSHLRALLDERATILARSTAAAAREVSPTAIVLSGSAFTDDTRGRALFAQELKRTIETTKLQVRLIPTHQDSVRVAARTVALDILLNEPLSLRPQLSEYSRAV